MPPEEIGMRKGSAATASRATAVGLRRMTATTTPSATRMPSMATAPRAGWLRSGRICGESQMSDSSRIGVRLRAPSIAHARTRALE